jgi:chromosome segregation ATPase
MKKITVLMLVLGLAMPVNAWTLFPLRKEIVTIKEIDWATTLTVCAIALGVSVSLLVGAGHKFHQSNVDKNTDIEDKQERINDLNESVRILNERTREKDTQIETLNDDIERRKEQVRLLQAQYSQQSAEILENQQKSKDNYRSVCEERDNMRREVQRLNEQIARLESSSSEDSAQEIIQLRTELAKANDLVTAVRSQGKNSQDLFQQANNRCNKLIREVKGLTDDKAKLNDQLAGAIKRIRELEAETSPLRDQIASLRAELAKRG